jgi:hypothetical protein
LHPSTHSDVEQEIEIASFKLSMLNRYFIFKKTRNIDLTEPSRVVNINHKINIGKILTPYFDSNKLIINPAKKSNNINNIYHHLRKKYAPLKPSVYLIKHKIGEYKLYDIFYRKNNFDFIQLKNGTDPKILFIYKSPENFFYPIYYQNKNEDDAENYFHSRINIKNKGTYLFDSEKIANDLNFLVGLSKL